MSLSPNTCENSPEPAISDVCRNLEAQFTQDLSKAEGMQVFARVRPMLNSETEAGYKECFGTIDDQTIRAIFPSSSVKFKSSSYQGITEDFQFTAAYGPEVGQFVFFQESMMNTMQNFIEGQNSLVFSYGITGSGKTFTLQGDINNPGIIPLSLHLFFSSVENQLLDRMVVKPDKFAEASILNQEEIREEYKIKDQLFSNNQEELSLRNTSKKSLAMVLCETFSDAFHSDGIQTTLGPEEMAQAQAAALMKQQSKKSALQQNGYCSVWVSFAEIYNEYIYDLLQPNVNQRTKLTLGEDKNGDVYVKGLREVCVFSSFEALKLLNIGQRNLKIASTKLNYRSSRSHCIFTVKVIRIPDPENITFAKVSRLSFCDLAGSERATKSQTIGLRLKEAGCINTSLLVLGRCLEQLRLNPSLRDKKRIPFRESKLTRLLSGFFTGRGKAVMITNASPSEVTFDETLHALRFSALATELIINDSYIATASNTLQTITNMWTNARNNESVSSDKSISFEDSTMEALQEKDELIEKLLDLAESLTKNLEKEKKEKAELEIKIRQDVCQEYSEYSDELLERQKTNYEEEKDTIREVHKERIARMEDMYEKIIKDLRSQLEESDMSGDEITDDSNLDVKNNEKKSAVFAEPFNGDTNEETQKFLCDMQSLKEDLHSVSEELKRVKEELERSRDYCLSLESASEEMEKKLEISSSNFEKALSENCELRIKVDQLQASLQDAARVKKETDNELNNAPAFTKSEREDLYQKLAESEKEIALLHEEVDTLLMKKNDLSKLFDECKVEYQNSLDAAKKRAKDAEEVLMSVNQTLDIALIDCEDEKKKLSVLEAENGNLKEKNADLYKKYEDLEIKYSSAIEMLEFEKNKFKPDGILQCDEVFTLEETKCNLEEKLEEMSSTMKELESEKETCKQELDTLKTKLCEALTAVEDEKRRINELHESKSNYEKEIAELQKSNKEFMDKLSEKTEAESEKETYKQELDTMKTKLCEALTAVEGEKRRVNELLENKNKYEKEIAKLQKSNKEFMDQISNQSTKAESEKETHKQELDSMKTKLGEALTAVEDEKRKVNELLENKSSYEKEIAELQKSNKEFMDKISNQSTESESEKETYKQELNTMKIKLCEALAAVEDEKRRIHELLENKSNCEKEIAELQKSNKEFMDKISNQSTEAESEKETYKQELETMKSKLCAALEDERKRVNELLKNKSNYEKEITELQKSNKEFMDKISNQSTEAESEREIYKQELETLKSKHCEALTALEDERKIVNELLKNESNYEKEISELQKSNKEFMDKISTQSIESDSTVMAYKDELKTINIKLIDVLSALDKKQLEVEDFASAIDSYKTEIAELQKQNKELMENPNSQADHKESEGMITKLEEALSAREKQQNLEIETLTNAIDSDRKKIAELEILNKKLQDDLKLESENKIILEQEMDSQKNHLKTANKHIKKLENLGDECQSLRSEISDLKKIEEELKEKLNSQEFNTDLKLLNNLIQILQRCELLASNNTKELHNLSIKHVEQIMDLEKCIKERDASIESLKNDYGVLQKQLKDFQATSKKELQASKHRCLSEIDSIKSEKIEVEKENKTLKNQVTELEAVKNSLESEVKNTKMELEKLNESINQVSVEKKSLETKSKNSSKTEQEKETPSKESDAKRNSKEKAEKKSKKISKGKKENVPEQKEIGKSGEKFAERRTLRRALKEPEENIKELERKTSKNDNKEQKEIKEVEKRISKNVKNQSDRRKNKSNENSNVASRDKKLKTIIYEEEEENTNNGNITPKVKSSNRKQLMSVENVTPDFSVVKNKDLILPKNRGPKRKEMNEGLNEKKTLKKIKLHDMNDSENQNKPQNLRIQLLKANKATNDIHLPSPRMTRGRKRLCDFNAKDISKSKGNARTVRS